MSVDGRGVRRRQRNPFHSPLLESELLLVVKTIARHGGRIAVRELFATSLRAIPRIPTGSTAPSCAAGCGTGLVCVRVSNADLCSHPFGAIRM